MSPQEDVGDNGGVYTTMRNVWTPMNDENEDHIWSDTLVGYGIYEYSMCVCVEKKLIWDRNNVD